MSILGLRKVEAEVDFSLMLESHDALRTMGTMLRRTTRRASLDLAMNRKLDNFNH